MINNGMLFHEKPAKLQRFFGMTKQMERKSSDLA